MNRIAVVLLATIGCVGHAQSASSIDAEIPAAPQAQPDGSRQVVNFTPILNVYLQSQQVFLHQASSTAESDMNSGPEQRGFLTNHAAVTTAAPNSRVESLIGGSDSAKASPDADGDESDSTGYKASSYVPLDSWIYPAFDRLAALGYLPTSSATVRPWTRLESARLLAEAHTNTDAADETTLLVFAALDAEFAHETSVYGGSRNAAAQVESTYARYTELGGTPLRDAFHFAQSISDDFGRPYGKGGNAISGLSARAEAGRFSVYFRGEYQYASAIPDYSLAAQQTIASYDALPFGWSLRSGTTGRPRPIEAYAALNLANWQLSFGQQALWWGPDRFTSLILSNNAEAMPMLRLARVKPAHLPGMLAWMGPLHFEFFFSREGGIHYVGLGPTFILYGNPSQPLNPPPYLWGMAFSIKPTANLEIGFAHTTIFAGYGRPLNLRTFLHTFSIFGNGQAVDPGKRVTEFNLTYHPPGLRRRVVLYSEDMAWDDPIEGKFLARYAMAPGLYIPRIPGLDRLDLRMEGAYTNLPNLPDIAYFYWNLHYPQGYTNYGQIMGSWIGRQGDGGQASTSYWFSPRNKASISYRKMSADKSYLQGGRLDDIAASLTWMLKPGIEVSASGQFEQWKFPLLSPTGKSDFATTFEIRAYPKLRLGFR
jgi:hypothetical protein